MRSENSASSIKGTKRSAPDSAEPQFLSQDGEQEELEDGLKAWGYMPGHVHYKVGGVEEVRASLKTLISSNKSKNGPRKDSPTESSVTTDVLEKVLSAVPPRSITGMHQHREILSAEFLIICRRVR